MVLDAATSIHTLMLGPCIFMPRSLHFDQADDFSNYLHGGPFGDAPGPFDDQAQTQIQEFIDTISQEGLGWGNIWRTGRLHKSQRQFEIFVAFEFYCYLDAHVDRSEKVARIVSPVSSVLNVSSRRSFLQNTLVNIDTGETIERQVSVVADWDSIDQPLKSCSELQQWLQLDEHDNVSPLQKKPISNCTARHMWELDLVPECLMWF